MARFDLTLFIYWHFSMTHKAMLDFVFGVSWQIAGRWHPSKTQTDRLFRILTRSDQLTDFITFRSSMKTRGKQIHMKLGALLAQYSLLTTRQWIQRRSQYSLSAEFVGVNRGAESLSAWSTRLCGMMHCLHRCSWCCIQAIAFNFSGRN
jgi:hypothetical protein